MSHLQMTVQMRKDVIDHAIRLPLHRVQELKSGGAASILRQDAGSVGERVFGMLYNPWQATTQLLGSMAVLAYIDWRLLLGALVLVPLVYLTHRTWISRIRPQFRSVRAQREEVDAMATETFGGMRVVRGFNRQRAETNRIMRGNHVMGRGEGAGPRVGGSNLARGARDAPDRRGSHHQTRGDRRGA